MALGPASTIRRTTSGSLIPAPACKVSAMCLAKLSASDITAAIPPCAQLELAFSFLLLLMRTTFP